MGKTNFWNDAARYGVLMALVAIVFDTLGFYTQHALLSLLSLILFVLMLTWFMRLRVSRYGAHGYGYGKCLGFMVGVMLCAGFIEGAYMSVAANWLFAAKYDAMTGQQLGLLESTGFYTSEFTAVADFRIDGRFGLQGRILRALHCGLYAPGSAALPAERQRRLRRV